MYDDPLSARDIAMLEAVRSIEVPDDPESLMKASPKIITSSLYRAAMAPTLLDRIYANARLALRFYMELLSVKFTQQRWADGIEFALWKSAQGVRKRMNDDEAGLLKALAHEARGWYMIPDDTDEPKFVSMDDWLAVYEDWSPDEE